MTNLLSVNSISKFVRIEAIHVFQNLGRPAQIKSWLTNLPVSANGEPVNSNQR